MSGGLLPSGEGGAEAPDVGGPPHDFVDLHNRGAGRPHPALRATLSQRERAVAKLRSRFLRIAGTGIPLEFSGDLIGL
jgi:hypothetical protein